MKRKKTNEVAFTREDFVIVINNLIGTIRHPHIKKTSSDEKVATTSAAATEGTVEQQIPIPLTSTTTAKKRKLGDPEGCTKNKSVKKCNPFISSTINKSQGDKTN